MVADERHKSAAFQHFCRECITASFDELQFLMFRISHGKNHSPAFGKLRQERLWNSRSGSGNEYGIERSELREAKRAVTAVNMCIGVTKPGKLGGSTGSELRPPFDRENFCGQTREHGCMIAAARANFQNPVARLQVHRRVHSTT